MGILDGFVGSILSVKYLHFLISDDMNESDGGVDPSAGPPCYSTTSQRDGSTLPSFPPTSLKAEAASTAQLDLFSTTVSVDGVEQLPNSAEAVEWTSTSASFSNTATSSFFLFNGVPWQCTLRRPEDCRATTFCVTWPAALSTMQTEGSFGALQGRGAIVRQSGKFQRITPINVVPPSTEIRHCGFVEFGIYRLRSLFHPPGPIQWQAAVGTEGVQLMEPAINPYTFSSDDATQLQCISFFPSRSLPQEEGDGRNGEVAVPSPLWHNYASCGIIPGEEVVTIGDSEGIGERAMACDDVLADCIRTSARQRFFVSFE